MLWILVLSLVAASDTVEVGNKRVTAVYTATPPVIDGQLERVWFQAQPITEFIQQEPDEGAPASESTEVYVLYDDDNLYVAFRCYQEKVKAWVASWDNAYGDRVALYLDTFGDKRTSYGFEVNAMGIQEDFLITNDGRSYDDSWDGIWIAEAKITSEGYVVEMAIPFKSLRYKKGLESWGINFRRRINSKDETDYWAPMSRTEGLRVSKFGTLVGLHPRVVGRYLEIYPVGLIRNDKYPDVPSQTKPHVGLDVTWSPGPQTQVNFTVNPDFGEVEADPYKINLSKYRLFYRERRPFFTEGSEYFRVKSMGGMNVGPMIYFFYSRNVGRKLWSGEEVPISFGAKITHKSTRWETGFLLVRTEPKASEYDSEPLAYFGVFRPKYTLFGNSTVGLFLGTKEAPQENRYTRIASVDLNLRNSSTEFRTIGALANIRTADELQAVLGKYMDIGYSYQGRKWFSMLGLTYIDDKFDINELGYVGLPGVFSVGFFGGPMFFPKSGPIRSLMLGAGGGMFREFAEGVNEWTTGLFIGNLQLRNLWGGGGNISFGRSYEQGQYYTDINVNLNIYSPFTGDLCGGLWSWFGYGYNYRREYFAWKGNIGTWTNYSFNPSTSFSFDTHTVLEFRPDRSLEEITFIVTPRFTWNVTRDLQVSSYAEGVATYTTKEIGRVRIGALLKWRVAPKSWFYIALNDLETRPSQNQAFTSQERVALVKIRYLFYF